MLLTIAQFLISPLNSNEFLILSPVKTPGAVPILGGHQPLITEEQPPPGPVCLDGGQPGDEELGQGAPGEAEVECGCGRD